MPGPSMEEKLAIEQPLRPSIETLLAAIADATAGRSATDAQAQALAELRASRTKLARPLDPSDERPPTPADRARITNLAAVNLTVVPDALSPAAAPVVISLGPDLVSVAVALSDELHLNELAAGVLLYDARVHAAHRSDHDAVAAAKDLFYLRRRESLLYLQELLRAGLLAPPGATAQEIDAFIPRLMQERDALVNESAVFTNVARRLAEGINPTNVQSGPSRNPRALQKGEAVLLAETLFLLAYTVQLSREEALSVRKLVDQADEVFRHLEQAELGAAKARRLSVPFTEPPLPDGKEVEAPRTEDMSPEIVEAESVRNLVLLAWMCALDRSRDHDIYDPRTGQNGVNLLLKDLGFIPRTTSVPPLGDNEDTNICNVSKAQAAAEVVGALFRLAVATPDEEEAKLTALRFCAYGGALSFLANDMASWIRVRAGSLCADTDLYADVVEDLALDIAEASQFVSAFISFTQQEVSAASAEVAYAGFDSSNSGLPAQTRPASAALTHHRQPHEHRGFSLETIEPPLSSSKRQSMSNTTPRGKPPRPPPSGGSSARPQSYAGSGLPPRPGIAFADNQSEKNEQQVAEAPQDSKRKNGITANLIAGLASFLAEAISLAPSKLSTDSIGGGLRYWSGIGAPNTGVIHQIGDAVIDLNDAAMGDPYAPGRLGDVFRDSLSALLLLLARTAQKDGSPSHASSSLQYLRDSGQTAVTLERASQALNHFHSVLSGVSSRQQKPQLDESDVNVLCGVLDIIANAAETLRPHGGINLILGERGVDMAMRMSSLVVHDVPPVLKESLLSAMCALADRRAISLFLESVASDKAAPLRHFLRSVEAQSGTYDVTVKVLSLTEQCVAWGEDEFPDAAIEAITSWFAIEEVLTFWSRRKYSFESHRWRVVRAAASLICAVVDRNRQSERSNRIAARLLTPAPGTGAASYAFRALVCTAGLMRAGDERNQRFLEAGHLNVIEKHGSSFYNIAGRDSLIHAAERGLGESFREMQLGVRVAARVMVMLLSVVIGRVAATGAVVAPAFELLLGEAAGISHASSLVFTADNFNPAISRAGYSPSVCAAVLEMLAKAACSSPNIAAVLARDPPGINGSAIQFRASLANIIARSTTESMNVRVTGDESECQAQVPTISADRPIMFSALQIVEASLADGGGAPGIFLLGLELDSSGLYSSAQYGVLGALVELVAGAHDNGGRIDDKCRATAATFLERLAATTIRRTSLAVLEHLREVAKPSDPNVRGAGFADEMLFRIMEVVGGRELDAYSKDVDWASLGELLTACMSLSALQVRLFPKHEIETCFASRGLSTFGLSGLDDRTSPLLPSPLDLLNVLALIASSGQIRIAGFGLRAWCHLLGCRLGVHERNTGYSAVPLLFELTSVLLGALAGVDSGNELSALVRKDGGKMASSMALMCIYRMRDCDNPHEPGSEGYIGDVQCTALLSGVVRAIAGVSGDGAEETFARTALYAALLVCGALARSRVSDDAVARAFGGRLGPLQVSGAEAVLSVASADGISGPRAGARATAMAVTSMTILLDPVRSMPVLGAQNRLRRVIHSSLADPEARKLIAQACSISMSSSDGNTAEAARERAALAVAESAIALIHAVSSVGHGARVIADSGCIESAGLLLSSLGAQGFLDFGGENDSEARRARRGSHAFPERQAASYRDGIDDEMDGNYPGFPSGRGTGAMDLRSDLDRPREAELRVSMIASITGAIAAATCCGNTAVIESTLAALDESKTVLTDLLRGLRSPRGRFLEAVSSIGMIISRVPYELLTAAAGPTQLRMSLASVIGAIIPAVSNLYQIGGSGSLFSAGSNLKRPKTTNETRRLNIVHPEGGSLFERDLVAARASCAQNVFASLRCPAGLLFLFVPHIGDKQRSDGRVGDDNRSLRHRSDTIGRLSEVVRISKVTLKELQRSAEESMQIDTRIAGETGTSISSRRVNEMAAFCQEQYGVGGESLTGQIVIDCLKKSSQSARNLADVCINILEATLFILREYVRTARETLRGYPLPSQRPSVLRGDEHYGEEEGAVMTIVDAEALLEDAKNVLVPICKEVEGLAGGFWGGKDSSFCKQLCRQIRTACTGRV